VNWSDLENNDAKMFVCDSSSITSSGCSDGTFCSTSFAQTNPMQCSYEVTSSENRTTSFWVMACDSINCSETNQSQFYMNHDPLSNITQPNGGETVNQSVGNYSILFDVSDIDSDSLTASIYYGETQNSTTNLIAANLNLSNYCTDTDSDTSTTNPCNYSWYSAGIYGTFFLTIILNDSYSTSNESSDASFNVRSLIDLLNPNITAQWTDTNIYSGKQIQFYANVTDLNINTVWVSINTTPQTNLTMTSEASPTFNATWAAPEIGAYSFKTYANDTVGNLNDTMTWTTFTVLKPNASTQNELSPPSALPYNVIQITGELNASNPLIGIHAYLNVPDGFTFLSDYPQNLDIGNFSANETKTATWFLSTPLIESTYTMNITYTDEYSNSWNSSNTQVQITSDLGGGYLVSLSGYPEVETSDYYYAESSFTQSGIYTDADSMTILIYDSTGSLIVGPVSMNHPSTGDYNYSYLVPAAPNEGEWETIVNATKNGISYYANQFWNVVGGPFDVRDIVINDNDISSLEITVTTENTGGAIKDLILTWNLSREDTGEILDTGADTFAVDPYSTKNWTIHPTTTYVGQTRITFIGFYSDTEKAGAYKVFSTIDGEEPVIPPTVPSSGGGGGGGGVASTEPDLEMKNFNEKIYLSKNIEKEILLEIYNNGSQELTNLSLTLKGVEDICRVIPEMIQSLNEKETATFTAICKVINFTGERNFSYIAKTNEITKTKQGRMIILNMSGFFQEELKRLT
ncbi:MAG: hypothetical protein OEL89_05045, partial [Candidatus Peregrinibacteria bacterium]|nr:hypothetical protein [Candidatus Peregrinibacteria bacterium]